MPKTRSIQTRSSKTATGPPFRGADDDKKTDILISIKSPYMNNIVARSKNHEFRKYLISRTVERMWLYVSSPDQTLRYIAIISQGKAPGEIPTDLEGLGNADFNNGLKTVLDASYAYEIMHLYRLRLPLHISVLNERYGISPPQRYAYIPKQLLDDVKLEEQEMLF
ncbi:hypothetical protein B0H19DRAFT_325843 [Mycena capillaripes]|nr:hypothetical protein B0H19DRAFT_325843 [Mycena capillaripes]